MSRHSLICFDCGLLRNRFGMEIKHMNKIIGYVCIKCAQKREVQDRPAGMGWRAAFKTFIVNLHKARQKAVEQLKRKPVLGRAV